MKFTRNFIRFMKVIGIGVFVWALDVIIDNARTNGYNQRDNTISSEYNLTQRTQLVEQGLAYYDTTTGLFKLNILPKETCIIDMK